MIERILICSDFLMTKEKEQASNRRWMVDLLRRPIERATGITPESFGSSLRQSGALSRQRFFELSDISFDVETAHCWYDEAKVSSKSLAYLREFLNSSTLVIGYELSQQTRSLLDQIGARWIDVWLHPIRFLDDILFAFSSSCSNVFEAMTRFHVNDDVIQLYADRLRIQYYKGYKRPDLPIRMGSALFIGQTLQDKAICDHGRMLNLLDFKGAFERAGKEFGTVYFSRHPYVKSGDETILKYVRACGFAQIVEWPAYHAIASGRLAKVFSISSSVVHEAKYFDLETEFLFRPVIDYGVDRAAGQYLSVYQEFVSPHFWSLALAPLLHTRSCDRIGFLEPKDKLRDMLNFYWSYRHVDKQEEVRQTVGAIDRKIQANIPPATRAKPATKRAPLVETVAARPWDVVEDEIAALMQQADVISFDVFDTLLERPFEQPNDLFDLLTPAVRRITGRPNLDFRALREQARALVPANPESEEVPLVDRYLALVKELKLLPGHAEQMLELEEESELRLCRPRPAGQALYFRALQMGKRVVLTSDTFFSGDFIGKLLRKNGYLAHEGCFISSVEGKLKQTGSLFTVLLERCAVSPDKVLHIGDHEHADIRMAGRAGLKTYHLQRSIVTFNAKSQLAKRYMGGALTLRSVTRGLIANKLCDHAEAIPQPSFSGNDAYKFGYGVAGPLFFGFAKWIVERAIADKVETLYFLSRDGEIALRCYEQVAHCYPKAPRARYLRASRRALNVAALESTSDVLSLLEVSFTPMPILELMRSRFGLDDIEPALLQQFGYLHRDATADWTKQRGQLRELVTAIAPTILANAAHERALLISHYKEEGLFDSGHKAIVDIGHAGTLQSALSRVCGDPLLGGYYFATDRQIEKNVVSKGMPCYAYYAERLDRTAKPHTYLKHILMFESLFLNAEGSFVRMVVDDTGKIIPELMSTQGEEARIDMIRRVHEAARSFTQDIVEVFGTSIGDHVWDAGVAVAGYVGFLSNPAKEDALMFANVGFENVYSGRRLRKIIDFRPEAPELMLANSIWKEGAKAIAPVQLERTALTTNHRRWRLHIVSAIIRRTVSDRKYAKFLRSPEEFFRDSRVAVVRRLGRILT